MRTLLKLTDHTNEFLSYRQSYLTMQGSEIKPKNESKNDKSKEKELVEAIKSLFDQIDNKTEELKHIVKRSHDFDATVEKQCRNFKECVDMINMLSNQIMKLVKIYEGSKPLVYRHYILQLE